MSLTIYADTGYAGGAFNPSTFVLSIEFGGETASLNWPPVAGAIDYDIYAGCSDEEMLPYETEFTGTSLNIENLNQPIYCFQVIANLGNKKSIASQIARNTQAGVLTGPIYFGFVPSLTPTTAQIQAMQSVTKTSITGLYNLTQPNGGYGYPTFAIPVGLGTPNSFVYSGFPYGMDESQVTINGVPYNLFADPYETYATAMAWSLS